MESPGNSDSEDIGDVDQSRKLISSPDGTDMKGTTNIKGCSNFTVIHNLTADAMNLKSETTTINNQKGPWCSNSCHRNGTMEEGALDILIKETKDVFVETSILKRVEESLKTVHHVTISGASGEGKTSIALMIGDMYRTRGYQLLLVNNIDRFRLHLDGVEKLLLIFDDIFGTVGLSTNVPHLQSILEDIQLFLGDAAKNQKESDMKKITSRLKLYVIFTTKTYNLEYALSRLEGNEVSFFKSPSVLDLSLEKDYRYSKTDRKKIFQKHKQINNFEGSVDIDSICNNDNVIFGFPLTCRLFYRFHNFQNNFDDFFRKPLFYLKTELSRILKLKNDQSAALILMLLCDGSLVLQQVESRSEVIESKMKLVEHMVGSITPTDMATAARHFRGTFFTEGEIIGFSHPTLYDSCACALYAINPSLVLQNCSIKFLYERVRPEPVNGTAMNDHIHIIYVSENYFEIIAGRFAEAIEEGNYSMSISHPILKVEALVDRVFEKLKLKRASRFDHIVRTKRAKRLAVLHDVNEDKYLLQWAALAKSLYLVKKILTIGYKFTDTEIIECFNTCATCGNPSVMEYLLQFYSSVISSDHVRNALDVSVDNHHLHVVHLLIQHGAGLDTLSHERQKLLFQDAAEQGDRYLCNMIITAVIGNERKQLLQNVDRVFKRISALEYKSICNMILGIACTECHFNLADIILVHCDINSPERNDWPPVMKAAYCGKKELFDLLVTKGADLTLTDKYGHTVLHPACWGGNTSIVEHLLPSFDINSRGENGWTPVMIAAYSGKKEVFHLLVTKGADLTLTDNYGDTVLHLACREGNESITKHLLPSFDINSRGENGWTPVMSAAYGGKKEVFDLLVTKGADLTLTDNHGDTVLHFACRGGNASITEHLLPSFDINSLGKNGWTPVMNAAYSGKNDVFDLLMIKVADLTLTDNYGETVLHLACQGGNTSIVEHLLPSFDINSRGENGWTPVMNAAYSGKKEVFDLLVTKVADLTLTDDYGDTVLHLACRGGNESITKHLFPLVGINSRGNNGWTPVMNAAYSGKEDAFYLLVTKGADLTLTDNYGDTVLHLACRGGNTSIVEHLLPSFDINSRGENGWTPVMNAAYSGKKEVFDLLVTKGADPSLTDNYGDTVLHLACQGGNTSIVEHLLQSFDINSRGNNGWTPVMNAAYSGKKELFDLLVTKGANLTLTDSYGDTVLHLACQGGNTSITEHLLPLFDINSRGEYGWTPVRIAAYSGKKEVFHLLVTKGANLTLTDNYGDTVLHLACQGGNTSIVEHLLPSFDINSRGNNGWTPVMNAANSGRKKVFNLLVAKGANLTLTDNYGYAVLHLACRGGNTSIVEHLLPSFDINSRGHNGRTPVMNASKSGRKKVFDLLVAKGADLTLTDNYGDTVLHLACQGGNTSIVEHLLPSFDINSRGENGRTPVMNAAYSGTEEVFDLVVTKGADLTLTDNYVDTVLHLACRGGNVSITEHLLPSFDINSQGNNGWTPVMNAAYSGKKEVFDLLVTHGTDITPTDYYGDTILHIACQGGNTSIVEHLLPLFDINSRGQNGWTPVMNAAYNAEKDVFGLLMTNGADITPTDNVGYNILHLACRGGNTDIVRYTLPFYDVNVKGWNSHTPLMRAVCGGHLDVVDLLMSNNADVNQVDDDGDSLLHLACESGNLAMVKHVFPYFDINLKDKLGWTPLMQTVVKGHLAVFQYIVDNGADLTLTDSNCYNILHQACSRGHIDIVRYTLPLYDVNVKGWNGHTPLMMAVYGGHIDVVDFLLSNNADLNIVDDDGNSLLHLACESGNLHMVEHVLPFSDLNGRDKLGWTPLMYTVVKGHLTVFQYLVDEGANLTLTDGQCYNILHQACRRGNIDIARYMLPLYDVNVKGCNSHTPLMMAAYGGHIDLVDFLLSNNADVNLVDDDGDSLLHLACESGNLHMVKHVFPFSDINLKDKLGLTPLMLTILNGKLNVYQYLVDKGASLDLVDNVGDDVLTLAYRGGCKEIIQQFITYGEEIQRIEKWTELMYHVAFGHWTVLKETQHDSPELLQRDGFGDTLLHLACRGGDIPCVLNIYFPPMTSMYGVGMDGHL